MTTLYLQAFACPYDENTDNTIEFQEIPIDEESGQAKYLKIIPNSSNDRLVGIAGDLNITYKYDKDNPAHIQEIARLSSLYETIDHDGILTVIVNFNNYQPNTWKQYNQSDSSWASTILEYTKIKPDTSPVALYRFIVGNMETRFTYCKLSDSSISMSTEYSKTIYTLGNIVEVIDQNGVSKIMSENNRAAYKLSGPVTFTCNSAEAYILVIEDIT
jgi:hypothetical protein